MYIAFLTDMVYLMQNISTKAYLFACKRVGILLLMYVIAIRLTVSVRLIDPIVPSCAHIEIDAVYVFFKFLKPLAVPIVVPQLIKEFSCPFHGVAANSSAIFPISVELFKLHET